MKIPRLFFYLFAIAFFAFSVSFISFMNFSMTDEEGGSRFWMMRILLLLDVICIVVMILRLGRSYRGIHLICILWLLIMPVVMYMNNAPIADVVRTILWPLLFETTYLCCHNSVSRGSLLKIEFLILAIIGAIYFLNTRYGIERQTNTIYLCYLTLPWVLFDSSKQKSIIIVIVFTIMAMLSLKRSMLLTTVLVWFCYFLYGIEKRRNIFYTIIVSIVIFIGIFMLYDKMDESLGGMLTERVNREETDVGNDRMAIWNNTVFKIQNSPVENLIFGHGHFGVREEIGISAHNDFLEVIYDYGLVIFILYLGLWWYVLRRTIYLYKVKSSLFIPYAASFSIFLIMSLVSHLILYATYFNYLVVFWGMTEAFIENDYSLYLRSKIKIR